MGRLIAAEPHVLGYIYPNPLLEHAPSIQEVLGHGRFWDVYKATMGDKEVAMKVSIMGIKHVLNLSERVTRSHRGGGMHQNGFERV